MGIAVYFSLVLLLLNKKVSTAILDESKCSKFDYEYRILERIVFLEHKNNELEKTNTELVKKNEELAQFVKEHVNTADNIRTAMTTTLETKFEVLNTTYKMEWERLRSEMLNMNQQQNEYLSEMESKLENKTNQQNITLQQSRKELEQQDRTQTEILDRLEAISLNVSDLSEQTTSVAFSAQITNHQNYQSGNTVIFDHVLTNNGNAYNRATGVFTAPQAGTYLFSVSLQTRSGGADVYLRKGEQIIGRAYTTKDDGFDSSSATSVVNLVKGDTVYVYYVSGSSSTGYSFWYAYFCIFSGTIL